MRIQPFSCPYVYKVRRHRTFFSRKVRRRRTFLPCKIVSNWRIIQIKPSAIFQQGLIYSIFIDVFNKAFQQSITILGSIASMLFIFNNIISDNIVSNCCKTVHCLYCRCLRRIMNLHHQIGKTSKWNIVRLFPMLRQVVGLCYFVLHSFCSVISRQKYNIFINPQSLPLNSQQINS